MRSLEQTAQKLQEWIDTRYPETMVEAFDDDGSTVMKAMRPEPYFDRPWREVGVTALTILGRPKRHPIQTSPQSVVGAQNGDEQEKLQIEGSALATRQVEWDRLSLTPPARDKGEGWSGLAGVFWDRGYAFGALH